MVNNLGDRIKKARNRAGLTQVKLSRMLNIAYPTLNKYERGRRVPDAIMISRMIKLLKCDAGWLITGEGAMTQEKPESSEITVTQIPLLGKVPESSRDQVSDEILEYISLPGVPENARAFIVTGESMSPLIRDGDYVIIVPSEEIRSGEVIAFHNEWGELLIRRYRRKGKRISLVSDNPEYPNLQFKNNYQIIGKIISAWRPIKI